MVHLQGAPMSEHPFFAGLDAAQRQALGAEARPLRVPAGVFIFHMNQPADALYLVDRGRVVLEVDEPGVGPTQLEEVHGGDVLGLSWLFPPYRWQLDARAAEAVEATALPAAHVRRLIETDAALGRTLALRLLGKVYERLERARLQRIDVYRGRR
jgi:CRP/FNR family transcriptional regulator, cyclic AMP receptor protein